MTDKIILGSTSPVRQELLQNAALEFQSVASRIDEDRIRSAAENGNLTNQQMAAVLAREKARDVSQRHPGALVIGCDQVMEVEGQMICKPRDRYEGKSQLSMLSGRTHQVHSSVSIYENSVEQWNFTGTAHLSVKTLTDREIDAYLGRVWKQVQHCPGCYMLEKQGAWLFRKLEGDYFTVLGLPVIELLTYLEGRGISPV